MSTKEKEIKKAKRKKIIKKIEAMPSNCKTKCCKKFKDGENKRCSKCPLFDLIKKVA